VLYTILYDYSVLSLSCTYKSKGVRHFSMSAGTKEDESSTGHVSAAGFHHVMAHSHLVHFEIYEPFLIFQFFFGEGGCGKLQIQGHDCTLIGASLPYCLHCPLFYF
jgi:hypothetical protein